MSKLHILQDMARARIHFHEKGHVHGAVNNPRIVNGSAPGLPPSKLASLKSQFAKTAMDDSGGEEEPQTPCDNCGQLCDAWLIECERCRDATPETRKDRKERGASKMASALPKLTHEQSALARLKKILEKQNLDYHIIVNTPGGGGASMHRTRGPNPAITNARESMKEWELANGIDPDHDWSRPASKMASAVHESIGGMAKEAGSRWRENDKLPHVVNRVAPEIALKNQSTDSSHVGPVASGSAKRIAGREMREPGSFGRVMAEEADKFNDPFGNGRVNNFPNNHPWVAPNVVDRAGQEAVRDLNFGKIVDRKEFLKQPWSDVNSPNPRIFRGSLGTTLDGWANPPDAHFSNNANVADAYTNDSASFAKHNNQVPKSIGRGGIHGAVHVGETVGDVDWRIYNKDSSPAKAHPSVHKPNWTRWEREAGARWGAESQMSLNPDLKVKWTRSMYPLENTGPKGFVSSPLGKEFEAPAYGRLQKFFDSYRKPLESNPQPPDRSGSFRAFSANATATNSAPNRFNSGLNAMTNSWANNQAPGLAARSQNAAGWLLGGGESGVIGRGMSKATDVVGKGLLAGGKAIAANPMIARAGTAVVNQVPTFASAASRAGTWLRPAANVIGRVAGPLALAGMAAETKQLVNDPKRVMGETADALNSRGLLGRAWHGLSNPVKTMATFGNEVGDAASESYQALAPSWAPGVNRSMAKGGSLSKLAMIIKTARDATPLRATSQSSQIPEPPEPPTRPGYTPGAVFGRIASHPNILDIKKDIESLKEKFDGSNTSWIERLAGWNRKKRLDLKDYNTLHDVWDTGAPKSMAKSLVKSDQLHKAVGGSIKDVAGAKSYDGKSPAQLIKGVIHTNGKELLKNPDGAREQLGRLEKQFFNEGAPGETADQEAERGLQAIMAGERNEIIKKVVPAIVTSPGSFAGAITAGGTASNILKANRLKNIMPANLAFAGTRGAKIFGPLGKFIGAPATALNLYQEAQAMRAHPDGPRGFIDENRSINSREGGFPLQYWNNMSKPMTTVINVAEHTKDLGDMIKDSVPVPVRQDPPRAPVLTTTPQVKLLPGSAPGGKSVTSPSTLKDPAFKVTPVAPAPTLGRSGGLVTGQLQGSQLPPTQPRPILGRSAVRPSEGLVTGGLQKHQVSPVPPRPTAFKAAPIAPAPILERSTIKPSGGLGTSKL